MILLKDIILILFLAVLLILILSRLKIPPVIGFLLTGVLIGPSAFKFVKATQDIELLAEIGIILLMFTIGLEFSVDKIRRMMRDFLLFGGLQVLLCWIVFSTIFSLLDLSFQSSVLAGFILALSSTAIVLKLLQDGDDLNSPAGIKMTGILLFQDAVIIPAIIILPFITQFGQGKSLDIIQNILLAFASVIIIFLISKWLLPKIFGFILRLGIPDLLMVTVFVYLFGVALLAHTLGVSLAMSALVIGIAISDSVYAHQINTEIIPSKYIFISIFFISIGMFVDVAYFIAHFSDIILVTLGIIVVKTVLILVLFIIFRHPLNVGFMTALGLAHIGEFSFIILKLSDEFNLFEKDTHQLLLSAAVLSMFTVPLALKAGKKISGYDKLKKELPGADNPKMMNHHTIIAGLGVTGQNIIRVLKLLNIPYAIIDINPANIKKYKADNENIYYGSVDRRENLLHVGVKQASLIVVAINDVEAAKRTVTFARDLNPEIKIIVRVNFLTQVDSFYKLGADLVLSQDMETSLIFINHILKFYNMPDHVSRIQTNLLRKEHYRFFLKKEVREAWKIAIVDAVEQDNELFFISPHSKHAGKVLGKLEPFSYEDIKILGIIRQNKVLTELLSEVVLASFDTIIFSGNHAMVYKALDWMEKNN